MKYWLLITMLLNTFGCSSMSTVDARHAATDTVDTLENSSRLPPANTNENIDIVTQSSIAISSLQQHKWQHGSQDCNHNTDSVLEVFKYDQRSYILRENKCLNFEAPFMYVLIGDTKVLVLDTGTIDNPQQLPLYNAVNKLILTQQNLDGLTRDILVMHTHSHSDHYGGDSQFIDKPNVTLVKPNSEVIKTFFNFNDWPNGTTSIDLGNRQIQIIPTPGHQQDALTIYDEHTKWLLTGDTLYPGYIYLKDWSEYKQSIARLVTFAKHNQISAILGAHIEMQNKAGEFYPIGSTYQPNEASLVLTLAQLQKLNQQLNQQPNILIFNQFIIAPMNTFQKTLSTIGDWVSQ